MNDKKKLDYSDSCNMDDDDTNNPCLNCIHFIFPIGCMKGELNENMSREN